jgi:hypothetical protein
MSGNSFSLEVSPACMDLIPYVSAEVALGLQSQNQQPQNANPPKRTGDLARVNPNLENHVLSFLGAEDISSFAHTSHANQQQAVNHCFRRIKECTKSTDFCQTWPDAVTRCRGKANPFRAQDLLKIDGAYRIQTLENASPFLDSDAHNVALVAKLPHLEAIGFKGVMPQNLIPFATQCTRLRQLTLINFKGEEPIPGKVFFPAVFCLRIKNCNFSSRWMGNLLTHFPENVHLHLGSSSLEDSCEEHIRELESDVTETSRQTSKEPKVFR